MKLRIACVVVAFLSLALSQTPLTVAQTSTQTASALPRLVRFGGTVKDLNGNPLTGVVGVTFALYSEQTGGAPLWLETQNVTADGTGHYVALLGATKPEGLPTELFTSEQARWVGVQVSGQAEQPRVLLVSAPYALKAGDAETIGGLLPSAFVLAAPPATGSAAASSSATSAAAESVSPATTSDVTTTGGTIDAIPLFSTATNIQNSLLTQTGITAVNVGGKLNLPPAGTATASAGFNSRPEDFVASVFNSSTAAAVTQTFQWQAEPLNNDQSTATGTLNLLYATGTATPAETGLKISNKGIFTFATGQAFPGTGDGSVTSVATGLGLKGGTITKTGTLTIDTSVVPQLKANNSFTGTEGIIGSLGVNTTTPSQSLDVSSGNAIFRGPANFKTTGNTAFLYVGDTSHPIEAIWGSGLAIGAYQVPRAFFIQDKTGNVGIGTMRPTSGILTTVATSASVVGLSATGWTQPATSGAGPANGGDAVHATGGNWYSPVSFCCTGGAGLVATGGIGEVSGAGVVANGGSGPSTGPDSSGGVGIDATGGSGTFGGSGGSFIAGVGRYGGGDGIDAAAGGVDPSDAGFFTSNGSGCDNSACAGYFSGDINVTGAIYAGTKDFRIDHPLDPANKYLQHASIESSEMKNVYDGLVILDGTGEAVVQLPAWFEVVNGDFRYQLTAIGRPSPGLYIAQEISSNSFQIAGGTPGAKVSWQVTGVRHDPYAKAHPLVIEQQKNALERGNYIHPELYGAPEERSITWARHPVFMKRVKEANAKPAAQRAAMETSAQRAAHTEAR